MYQEMTDYFATRLQQYFFLASQRVMCVRVCVCVCVTGRWWEGGLMGGGMEGGDGRWWVGGRL